MIYISSSYGKKLCNHSTIAPFVKIVGTTDVEIKLNSKELSFFVSKKGCDDMLNIIKEELSLEESLRKKIEFICDFTNNKPTIINGSIRKIDKTNLTYSEPHIIIINNTTFLAFNYSNEIFIENLSNKIKLSELEDYLKTI